jgi:cobalt-zinc-cadmium efflux system protein
MYDESNSGEPEDPNSQRQKGRSSSNRPNSHNGHGFSRAASKKALSGALAILVVFLIAEFLGGILSGSLALLSDAGHLLTDVAAVGLALFAQQFAAKPSSPSKSFGFRRVEIMAALFNGLSLWVIAVFICVEASKRLIQPPPVDAGLMLAVASAGCAAQIGAALMLARAGSESLNVRVAYVHALTDAVQSVGVVVAGLVIMFTGLLIIDPIVSFAIALLIVWSSWKIVREAVHILLEGTPSEIDLERLARDMQGLPGVEKITDLHAWSVTSGYNALSAHVVAVPSLSAKEREEIRESLQELLRGKYSVHHSTLQVEESCTMQGDDSCSEWIDKR